jgi:hypothetical protein
MTEVGILCPFGQQTHVTHNLSLFVLHNEAKLKIRLKKGGQLELTKGKEKLLHVFLFRVTVPSLILLDVAKWSTASGA